MSDGRIYYAQQNGNYLLKLVGDVRVTLCTSLRKCIGRLFAADKLQSVVVDLREAQTVDSTTLGFLAKLAFYASERDIRPLLISHDPCMLRLIKGMGFAEIFQIVADFAPTAAGNLKEMDFCAASIEQTRHEVITAHRTLMAMNCKNMQAFSALVKTLEKESESESA
ncbi:MAG: STAS domain-containing protein [Cellvibrionales bacterium]|nr:STAS domain-containing protein [Cellvibrionales bacterium]